MRLTLRTLLAYRDGVLSPQDAEDMHRRIHQSEDAANLLKRIDAISAELQKPSSMIVGKGMGADPNSIAEYLDDVLAREKIPELEKTCLESNAYLAELASCHRLLSSALHTRVQVPESLRNSALEIGDPNRRSAVRNDLKKRQKATRAGGMARADQAHVPSDVQTGKMAAEDDPTQTKDVTPLETVQAEVVQVQAPMLASKGDSIKQQGLNLEGAALTQEVPEYLMGASRTNWKLPLAILGLLALLSFVVWQALGPFEKVQRLFASASPESEKVEPNREAVNGDAIGGSGVAPVEPREEDLNTANREASQSEVEDEDLTAPSLEERQSLGGKESQTPNDSAENINDSASASGNAEMAKGSPDPSSDPDASVVGASSGNDAGAPSSVAQGENDMDDAALRLSASEPEWDSLLLRHQGGVVQRVAPGMGVQAGEKLLVTPFSHLTLSDRAGVQWQFAGPSKLEVEEGGLQMGLGRVLLTTTQAGAQVTLKTPVANVRLNLVAAESTAAVEMAYRPTKHGALTEPGIMEPVLVIIAVDGTLLIEDVDDASSSHDLAFTEGLAFVSDQQPKNFRMNQIPTWYRMSAARPVDREAVRELSQDLVAAETQGKPDLADLLPRLASHRRPEEAALATQIQMLLGDWSSLASKRFLGNSRMSVHWSSTLQLASQLIAADAGQGANLKDALEAEFASGGAIYQMVVGVPSDRLESGSKSLSPLIDKLESKELAERVVALFQLQLLTGERFGFKPHDPIRASVLSWRRALTTNKLELTTVPPIIWESR